MRLVLAVDLADDPAALVGLAVRWAQRLDARLDLVFADEHSVRLDLIQDPAVRASYEREWLKVRAIQEDRLRTLLDGVPVAHRGEVVVRTGRAFDEIVAASAGADLLLVGTHGRRGLSHALLGSVAERVVRTATVPVLVLRS